MESINYVADAKLLNFINSRIDVNTYFNIPFIACETVVNYMNALSDKKLLVLMMFQLSYYSLLHLI